MSTLISRSSPKDWTPWLGWSCVTSCRSGQMGLAWEQWRPWFVHGGTLSSWSAREMNFPVTSV